MYRNMFAEIGLTQERIDARIREVYETIFEDEGEKFYWENPREHTAYFLDTGNNDARTEGMSYAMMLCAQLDKKEKFDKLWRFSYKHMLHREGVYEGYFAWTASPNGTLNAEGPAPDGEEYYALALFFASARWGDGEAPFDYSNQARTILRHCVHQPELAENGRAMWDEETKLIRFVPEADFTDASYHLPHFYDIFAKLADERDREFWADAARASREYLAKACHPVTGLAPELGEYDGTPGAKGKRDTYFSDAYRVLMNIGLDAAWGGATAAEKQIAENAQRFFSEHTAFGEYAIYNLDGTIAKQFCLHPTAIIATTAAASLASDGKYSKQWVLDFWNTPPRKGNRRYYDNCLYFFTLLMLAGEYKIYMPD